ncbi:MAG: ComF family protein [Woeseiaceae bacterium]|nr:ComF family protein [Woeseiaceae bacterium]
MQRLRQRFRKLAARACVFCGQPGERSGLCQRCRRVLPWNDNCCDCCGQPRAASQATNLICNACQQRPPSFEKARAPLVYDFPVDAALKAIKFRRQLFYLPVFAGLLAELLHREFPETDVLVPVPLYRTRQMRRGFNQAIEICRCLKGATGIPINRQAVRTRATPSQTGLNANERRRNVQGAFAVRGKLAQRRLLIVDDVITTGETCAQLASVLRKSGAEYVGVLAIARAYVGATGLKV